MCPCGKRRRRARESETRYHGHMADESQWTVRVTATDSSDCVAYARRHQIRLGAPISFDVEHSRATALEHFLAAVGGDIVGGLLARAKRMRIEIDNVEALVECSLNNPLTFLDVVGETGDPGIRELSVIVYIGSTAEDRQIRRLWEDTLQKSPMVRTLQGGVNLQLNYKVAL